MINKLLQHFNEFGRLNTFLYFLHRICSKTNLLHAGLIKYYIYFQPTYNGIPISRPQNIDISIITKESPLIHNFPRPSHVIERRYTADNICFGAYNEKEFVGFLWLAEDFYEEDEVRCNYHLRPIGKLCWDYDVYIDPKYRSGFAFAKLWSTAGQYMKEHRKLGTMSRVSVYNSKSIRSHERLGAVRLGTQTFFVMGILQIMASSMPPYLHISVTRSSRVQVTLHLPDTFHD